MTTVKICVGCIDGDAILRMADKPRMLKNIEIGDKVLNVRPVLCGDVLLADGSDYIANGFVVTSQISRIADDASDLTSVEQAVMA